MTGTMAHIIRHLKTSVVMAKVFIFLMPEGKLQQTSIASWEKVFLMEDNNFLFYTSCSQELKTFLATLPHI